ncbi:AbrB family transcriptional regulator [Martelella mediterranea]|uniref:AbrB family transcriptional regulator n=1 Tax=Martelella mediterranea TaxID=293089 RepID=UPI001E5C0BD4|nr:AbrB family transcriptional regulator [Martelella mediterranea]MCD1636498.1 AbrB family transcriptional regulator [Martelella mediterranea]
MPQNPHAPAPVARHSDSGPLRFFKVVLLLLASALAGWGFQRIGAPLPWMIGPLVLTSLVFMVLAPSMSVPDRLRPGGQVVVATQVGLAFSPAALGMLLELAPVIIGTALASGMCIMAVAFLFARLTRQSVAQSFLSSAPTSPVEAATMAAAAGLNPVPVIFSQTVRLAAVVLVVPFALYAIEGWPDASRPPVTFEFGFQADIVLLVVLGIAGAMIFRRLGVPNPNFLGPMTFAAVLSVAGIALTPYPLLMIAAAQIVLGSWLGAQFRREVLTTALGMSVMAIASSMLLLLLCSLCAIAIAAISGLDWKAVVLGAAPGGAVEMALTAKFLEENVVLITTFHIVRIFIFMPSIPWIVKGLLRYDQRNDLGDKTS